MTDSEQVRAFFRRMADGVAIQSNSDLLHGIHNRVPRTVNTVNGISQDQISERAFGVGLPPMANVR